MSDETATPAEVMAGALAELSEAFTVITEAAAGHRSKLENAGFSPTMSERGAMHLHAALIAKVFEGSPR